MKCEESETETFPTPEFYCCTPTDLTLNLTNNHWCKIQTGKAAKKFDSFAQNRLNII